LTPLGKVSRLSGGSAGLHSSYSKVNNIDFTIGMSYSIDAGLSPAYFLDINYQLETTSTNGPFKKK